MIQRLKQWFSSISWKINNRRALLIFPTIFITYILYIRIFVIRADRILFVNLTLYQVFILFLIISLLIWRIYILLKLQEIIPLKEPKNKIIVWIQNKIHYVTLLINQLWLYFYKGYIRDFFLFPPTMLFLLKIYIYKLPRSYIFSNFIILVIFEIMPKTILISLFLVDIFYFQKFHYFYKVLWLLLLPLTFKVLKLLLFEFYSDYSPIMEKSVIRKETVSDTEKIIEYTLNKEFTFASGVNSMEELIKNYYTPLAMIPEILRQWSTFMLNYKIYLWFSLYLVLYILGWIIILIYGIFFVSLI